MAKRTPLDCTPDNCGENFARCGKAWTYGNLGCRCDSCHAAKRANWKKYPKPRPNPSCYGPCTPDNCGTHFAKCGSTSTYGNLGCRCDDCRAAQRIVDREKHLTNRDARNKQERARHAANREQYNATSRAYAAQHRAEAAERAKRWREDNPERDRVNRRAIKARRRLQVAAKMVKFSPEQWEQKRAYWGNKCYLQISGICTEDANTMDHVKPLSAGGSHMLSNLRPACFSCNASKNDKWPFPVKPLRHRRLSSC
jgi:5-methylcytosine-specific restriction endonuclease McrA